MVTIVEQPALMASLEAANYVTKSGRWDRSKNVMDRFPPLKGDALVIDDDPDSRVRLRKALERDGWVVREAENGREGLDAALAGPHDVILLVMNLPSLDGWTVASMLRAEERTNFLSIIALTVHATSGDKKGVGRRLHCLPIEAGRLRAPAGADRSVDQPYAGLGLTKPVRHDACHGALTKIVRHDLGEPWNQRSRLQFYRCEDLFGRTGLTPLSVGAEAVQLRLRSERGVSRSLRARPVVWKR